MMSVQKFSFSALLCCTISWSKFPLPCYRQKSSALPQPVPDCFSAPEKKMLLFCYHNYRQILLLFCCQFPHQRNSSASTAAERFCTSTTFFPPEKEYLILQHLAGKPGGNYYSSWSWPYLVFSTKQLLIKGSSSRGPSEAHYRGCFGTFVTSG